MKAVIYARYSSDNQLEIRNPVIPKEQIAFALYNYRKLDMSVQSDRQKLIDSFVNSIYLYDDYFIITFNYKNKSKKVSLKEINSSSLTSSAPPIFKPNFFHSRKEFGFFVSDMLTAYSIHTLWITQHAHIKQKSPF